MAQDSAPNPYRCLTVDDVLDLHAELFKVPDADVEDRLRNGTEGRACLESAVMKPHTYWHYFEADIALQAAVLADGIAESQCFAIEGNKRTAFVCTLTFLEWNGYSLTVGDRALFEWITFLSEPLEDEDRVRIDANDLSNLIRPCLRQIT